MVKLMVYPLQKAIFRCTGYEYIFQILKRDRQRNLLKYI